MDGPHDPELPTIPQGIHRDDASQAEVDERMAGYARDERKPRADAPGVPHLAALLQQLVDGQDEQNHLLRAILRALQPSPGGMRQAVPREPEAGTNDAVR